MNAGEKRVNSLKALLAHVRERLGLDVGFVLWDGSTVPDGLTPHSLAIVIADEGTVAALIRRPNLDTLLNLWVASRLDLRNGTIFDLAARRPKVRTKTLLKSLDKGLLFGTLARFALLPRGGPWPLEGISTAIADGSVDANAANVQYHYDVSNAFYTLWLDRRMVYTCGYFTDWDNDIDQAQQDKLEMICRKLRLKPGETLLDIGCGWGALSCYAAQHYGVNAYAVTLAKQQVAYGLQEIKRLGLSERVKMEVRDYSTVEGIFDKVAAIGLHEHVGVANYPKYYGTIQRVLKPGGLFLHQASTRPAKRDDRSFRRKPPEMRAILRYIFPGAELDHIGNTVAMMERNGFEVHDVEAWREHYQRTCRRWHDRLLANYDAAVNEVGSEKTRLWLIYLAGVSLGFVRNTVRIFQTLASKRERGPTGLPPTRADLYR